MLRRKAGSPFPDAVQSIALVPHPATRQFGEAEFWGSDRHLMQHLKSVEIFGNEMGGEEVVVLQQNFHLVPTEALEKEKQSLGLIFQAICIQCPAAWEEGYSPLTLLPYLCLPKPVGLLQWWLLTTPWFFWLYRNTAEPLLSWIRNKQNKPQ